MAVSTIREIVNSQNPDSAYICPHDFHEMLESGMLFPETNILSDNIDGSFLSNTISYLCGATPNLQKIPEPNKWTIKDLQAFLCDCESAIRTIPHWEQNKRNYAAALRYLQNIRKFAVQENSDFHAKIIKTGLTRIFSTYMAEHLASNTILRTINDKYYTLITREIGRCATALNVQYEANEKQSTQNFGETGAVATGDLKKLEKGAIYHKKIHDKDARKEVSVKTNPEKPQGYKENFYVTSCIESKHKLERYVETTKQALRALNKKEECSRGAYGRDTARGASAAQGSLATQPEDKEYFDATLSAKNSYRLERNRSITKKLHNATGEKIAIEHGKALTPTLEA